MTRLPEDPDRAATILRRALTAARELMRRADHGQVEAALPRLRALLDGVSAMMLLVRHLTTWTIAVAQEAQEAGDEDRRIATLNLPAVLLSHVIAGAWEALRQDAGEAAADPIGAPAGQA